MKFFSVDAEIRVYRRVERELKDIIRVKPLRAEKVFANYSP